MSYAFDGVAKKIYLPIGMTVLDLQDLYSRWKDWVRTADNSKYPLAFGTVGGDIPEIPLYLFEKNGWYTVPYGADHTLDVIKGVFVREGGGDPFTDPAGAYKIRINRQVPGIAIGYSLGGSSVTPAEIASAVSAVLSGDMQKLRELHELRGLDANKPVHISDNGITTPTITQVFTKSGEEVVVTRE